MQRHEWLSTSWHASLLIRSNTNSTIIPTRVATTTPYSALPDSLDSTGFSKSLDFSKSSKPSRITNALSASTTSFNSTTPLCVWCVLPLPRRWLCTSSAASDSSLQRSVTLNPKRECRVSEWWTQKTAYFT